MISCILLSGGASSRYGSPKALAPIDRQSVIEKLQHMLLETPVEDIVVVLGAHLDEIKSSILKHKKIRFVYNKDYNLGQTSSFQCGLSALKLDCSWAFLMPVDYPFVSSQTITKLIKASKDLSNQKIIIPTYQDKKGHPPLLAQSLFHSIRTMNSNQPLNDFMKTHLAETSFIEVDNEGVLLSFNTPLEFENLKQRFI